MVGSPTVCHCSNIASASSRFTNTNFQNIRMQYYQRYKPISEETRQLFQLMDSEVRKPVLTKTRQRWLVVSYRIWASHLEMKHYKRIKRCRVQLKCNGTRWRTGGEVKGKLENGVSSQYPSHYLWTWCIQHYYRWCAHLACQ
jgi:hypothetical protein